MSLTRQFIREFSPSIRVRGESYFKRGRVSIERDADSPEQVTARVRGSDLYRVTLVHDAEHSTLKVACTCPYYDTDLCKHIWAAMIAADSRHLLPQQRSIRQNTWWNSTPRAATHRSTTRMT